MVRRRDDGVSARLVSAIVFCIVAGPMYRLIMWALGTTPFVDLLLPGAMDSLAMGALLAYAVRYPRQTRLWVQFQRFRRSLVLVFLGLAVAVQCSGAGVLSRVGVACCVSLSATCLVALAIDERSDWRVD